MTQPLINLHDVTENARPCRCDPELLARCIEEAQLLDIKNDIGEDIYLSLFDNPQTENITKLWNGGEYTDKGGKRHVFGGLKKALCYYTFARVCRSNGAVITRFDLVTKTDDYSNSVEDKRRAGVIADALASADAFKLEALLFIKNSGLFAEQKNVKLTNNRVKFRMIGN